MDRVWGGGTMSAMPARDLWDEMQHQLHAQTHETDSVDLPADARCTECERPIGKSGRWYSGGMVGCIRTARHARRLSSRCSSGGASSFRRSGTFPEQRSR